MLIRSQDKTIIVNIDNAFSIAIRDINGAASIHVGSQGGCCIIAEYPTKAKAMKVLDMIQEAYADAKLNKILLPDVCKSANESQRGKDNTLIAKTIRKDFMKKMIFQMPEDSEVEV